MLRVAHGLTSSTVICSWSSFFLTACWTVATMSAGFAPTALVRVSIVAPCAVMRVLSSAISLRAWMTPSNTLRPSRTVCSISPFCAPFWTQPRIQFVRHSFVIFYRLPFLRPLGLCCESRPSRSCHTSLFLLRIGDMHSRDSYNRASRLFHCQSDRLKDL